MIVSLADIVKDPLEIWDDDDVAEDPSASRLLTEADIESALNLE